MDIKTWTFKWMSEHDKITCAADRMLERLNFPRFEIDEERENKMHFWDVSNAQLHLLMDPKVGDVVSAKQDLKDFNFENQTLFHIICNALVPI